MSAAAIIFIVGGIGFVATLVLLIVLLLRVYMKVPDLPPNAPWLLNFEPSEMGGHHLAVVLGEEPEENGERIIFRVLPRDIPYNEKGQPKAVEPMEIPIPSAKVLRCPRGSLSSHREIFVRVPEHPSKISPELQTTFLGQLMVAASNETSILQNIKDSAELLARRDTKARRQIMNPDTIDDMMKQKQDVENIRREVRVEQQQQKPEEKK